MDPEAVGIFSRSARERGEFDKLLVRTHFGDDDAWQAVRAASLEPWGGGEFESTTYAVDDPRLAGASADDVRDMIAASEEEVSVVFIADEETTRSPHRALLALNLWYDPDEDSAYYSAEASRQCRVVPNEASGMHIGMVLANLDFQDWLTNAHSDPDEFFHRFS